MILDNDNRLVIGKGVNLKPFKPRPFIKREFMTDAEILANAGSELVLDTESFPNFFLAGFKHVGTGKYINLTGDFNPRFMSWLMFAYKTVGFNSINYDLPILWAAYVNRSTDYIKAVSNALILSGKRINEIAKEFNFECYKLPDRQHIDLFNVCPLKGSLKLYAARLHCKRIQDLPFPDTQELSEFEKEVVTDYNGNDLDNTEIIFKFCKERLELRESISLEYNEDLMSKSDAQMAEVVIPKEVGKLLGKWIKRPEIDPGTIYKYSVPTFLSFATPIMKDVLAKVKRADFIVQDNGKIALPEELKNASIKIGNSVYRLGIGGLHSSEECVGYISNEEYELIDKDMVSYYPYILTNLGLYPVALGPKFLTVFMGFREQRVIAKRNKNFTKDKGLKIFINGMSGKLSDPFSKMYSPDLTMQMTITGQLTLLMLVEMLECNGIKVISANTDGIVIYSKRSERDKLDYWIKYFEQLTGFQTEETNYKSYYARDVNNYIAVKADNKLKTKGVFAEVGSQSGTQLDTNPANLICVDAIEQFLINNIPIEQTIRNCKNFFRFVTVRNVKGGAHKDSNYLGKVIRYYYAKNEYGTINYVLNGNKVADTEGGKPCMDIPSEFPLDIDYDKYISLTKDFLYDINYFQRPKQVFFF